LAVVRLDEQRDCGGVIGECTFSMLKKKVKSDKRVCDTRLRPIYEMATCLRDQNVSRIEIDVPKRVGKIPSRETAARFLQFCGKPCDLGAREGYLL
jgi:hypothetical protein